MRIMWERWIFGHLKLWSAGIRADSTWPSSLTLISQLPLPGKLGDATHWHFCQFWVFSTNFLDFLPAHILSSVGPWFSQPSLLELQPFLFAGQKFYLNLIKLNKFLQSNGAMPAEKGSGGGDLPRQGGGEPHEEQGGEKNPQLQRNTLFFVFIYLFCLHFFILFL